MKLAERISLKTAAAAVACAALAGGTVALAASADASPGHSSAMSTTKSTSGTTTKSTSGTTTKSTTTAAGYSFTTLDNANDPTFNQLLGINNGQEISGYFGSGAAGHPNKGYLLSPPYDQNNYVNENFPGSAQTQVTGLNNVGNTVGFWANAAGANFGFYTAGGQFHTIGQFPGSSYASPQVVQLLGINDHGVAVGFFTNSAGNDRGFTYNIRTQVFKRVLVPGEQLTVQAPSLTAAGINNKGDITGFYTDSSGATDGFVRLHGSFITLAVPGASATTPLGINDDDEVVGSYTVGSGNSAVMHGFTWLPGSGFSTVDDPLGVGTTTINGLNDAGDLVGFYVDSQGNTDGFLAKPASNHSKHSNHNSQSMSLHLQQMPQGTVTYSRDGAGAITATVQAFGLTPGSSHAVVLAGSSGANVPFGTLTADATGQADATLDSSDNGTLDGGRLEILNGTGSDSVSTEPIAETSSVTQGTAMYQLRAVEVGPDGTSYGTPRGIATVAYNASSQTISVTVTASGLTPGPHAAHIHVGSCMSQGPVQYMLMDFVANSNGQIVHETRTVTGVPSGIPATGWYLNLHQGDSNTILSDGQPTIFFRPLLCANM